MNSFVQHRMAYEIHLIMMFTSNPKHRVWLLTAVGAAVGAEVQNSVHRAGHSEANGLRAQSTVRQREESGIPLHLGARDGAVVGLAVGMAVGCAVGARVGAAVGNAVGAADGCNVGAAVGTAVGATVQMRSCPTVHGTASTSAAEQGVQSTHPNAAPTMEPSAHVNGVALVSAQTIVYGGRHSGGKQRWPSVSVPPSMHSESFATVAGANLSAPSGASAVGRMQLLPHVRT